MAVVAVGPSRRCSRVMANGCRFGTRPSGVASSRTSRRAPVNPPPDAGSPTDGPCSRRSRAIASRPTSSSTGPPRSGRRPLVRLPADPLGGLDAGMASARSVGSRARARRRSRLRGDGGLPRRSPLRRSSGAGRGSRALRRGPRRGRRAPARDPRARRTGARGGSGARAGAVLARRGHERATSRPIAASGLRGRAARSQRRTHVARRRAHDARAAPRRDRSSRASAIRLTRRWLAAPPGSPSARLFARGSSCSMLTTAGLTSSAETRAIRPRSPGSRSSCRWSRGWAATRPSSRCPGRSSPPRGEQGGRRGVAHPTRMLRVEICNVEAPAVGRAPG